MAASNASEVRPSVCPLDCPDTCQLHITVQDGKVVKLEGDANHAFTRGFACVKTYRYPQLHQHPDRLLYPLRRIGEKGAGQFERISWDRALDEVAARLQRIIDDWGPQAILPYSYAGTMGWMQGQHALGLFRTLGCLELEWTICAATGGAAWEANYGPRKLSPDPEQLEQAELIILWGINAMRSHSHLAPWIKAARQRGAKVLHIDPYRNETSRFADEHWPIRVGTDAALALALGGEILRQGWQDQAYLDRVAGGLEAYRQVASDWPLERAADFCGLPLESVQRLAAAYGQTRRSLIKIGYGLTRNEGGGNALRAISLLPALSGAWLQIGCGASLSTSGGFPLNTTRLGARHVQPAGVRRVNMNCLGDELMRAGDAESPPIAGLIVFNSNPAVVAPDSGKVRAGLLRSDLLTVVLEHFQTDTADYADYVLPATNFLEHADLYTSYGHYHLQWAEPVVPPRGEARPNSWIFAELARRLGLTEPSLYWSADQLGEALLSSDHPWLAGIDLPRLKRERSIKLNLPQPFLPYADGSHFADGKIRFDPPPRQLHFEVQPSPQYPLRLISPPGTHMINTSLGGLEALRRLAGGEPRVLLHPEDAARLGVRHRQRVRLRSPHGSLERLAEISADCRSGVVIALGQWWAKLAPDGKGLNELTSQRLTDLGGGSTFGNVVVSVEPLTAAAGQPEEP